MGGQLDASARGKRYGRCPDRARNVWTDMRRLAELLHVIVDRARTFPPGATPPTVPFEDVPEFADDGPASEPGTDDPRSP